MDTNPSASGQDADEREWGQRATTFLYALLTQHKQYHQQKENMAHAALLLQGALTAWVCNMTQFPPAWAVERTVVAQGYAAVVVLLIWALAHVFLRQQQRLARWACIHHAAVLQTLRRWVGKAPDRQDLKVDVSEASACEKCTRGTNVGSVCGRGLVSGVIPWLVPIERAYISADDDDRDLPSVLKAAICDRCQQGTGFAVSEWAVCLASWVLCVILAVRVL